MIVCFLTMLIGIKDIMSTVYTWWQCPGRCWVVAPGSSPSPPALNYPTIHTKSGQSRQPTTVADPDPVYQQKTTGEDPDLIHQKQTTGADPDPVYQQQTTGADPDPAYQQQTTGEDPDPVFQQQPTVADPDPVYQQQTTVQIRIRSINNQPLFQIWSIRTLNKGSGNFGPDICKADFLYYNFLQFPSQN